MNGRYIISASNRLANDPFLKLVKRRFEEEISSLMNSIKDIRKATVATAKDTARHIVSDASMLTIHVGKEPRKRTFVVHESLIAARVAYFECMLRSGMQESHTKTVTFEEDNPDSWAYIIEWVYTGICNLPSIEVPNNLRNVTCAEIYLIADYLQASQLKDQLISTLFENFRTAECHFDDTALNRIYDNTPENAKIRGFLERAIALCITPDQLRRWRDDHGNAPPELLEGVTANLADRLEAKCYSGSMKICDFHEHAAEEKCTALRSVTG